MSLNILEYPSYTKSLEYLEIACWYWLLEYSRMLMKFQAQGVALLSAWNFMDVLEYSSFYKKIQQTMQIQELSRISKVFIKPWIFLEVPEFAWILGFSGKCL